MNSTTGYYSASGDASTVGCVCCDATPQPNVPGYHVNTNLTDGDVVAIAVCGTFGFVVLVVGVITVIDLILSSNQQNQLNNNQQNTTIAETIQQAGSIRQTSASASIKSKSSHAISRSSLSGGGSLKNQLNSETDDSSDQENGSVNSESISMKIYPNTDGKYHITKV